MKRPAQRLRALFERHPKLGFVDRALGEALAAFATALGVVVILGLPGLLPRVFLVACFWLLFIVLWAIGWRTMLMDRYAARLRRRQQVSGSRTPPTNRPREM
jgi:high-affinity Fe2+/Pb2+ permease